MSNKENFIKKEEKYFKRCEIILQNNDLSLGLHFNEKIKPKFIICDVEPNSPAGQANLKKTDIVIGINGINIRRVSFENTMRIITESIIINRRVVILAVRFQGYSYYKLKGKCFSSSRLVSEENIETFKYPSMRSFSPIVNSNSKQKNI